jgi:Fic family protein
MTNEKYVQEKGKAMETHFDSMIHKNDPLSWTFLHQFHYIFIFRIGAYFTSTIYND